MITHAFVQSPDHPRCRSTTLYLHHVAITTFIVVRMFKQESPLPLTDPRDAEAQRMLNIPYCIIW